MNLKHKDIFFPKSWFKKNCSSPTPGSYSFKCWLNTTLNNLPKYDNGCSAINAGLSEGSLFLNSLGQISTALCNGQCDFTQGVTFVEIYEGYTFGLFFNYNGDDSLGNPTFETSLYSNEFTLSFNNDTKVWEFSVDGEVSLSSTTEDIFGTWGNENVSILCGGIPTKYCLVIESFDGTQVLESFWGIWFTSAPGEPYDAFYFIGDDALFITWDEVEGKWLLGDTYLEGGSRTELPTGTFEIEVEETTATITISEGLCDVG
jgi:hypothetical protein